MSSGISAALVCFILCLWMHESITNPCNLDQHRAQQLHLWTKVVCHCPGSRAAILTPENSSLQISQQLPAGKWKGTEIQSLPRLRKKQHKGGKRGEQMPCTCICWLLSDVLWWAPTARAALPLLTGEHERRDKLSYTYSPFWPSQKLEIHLKQMSADQAGKTWPSLWQPRTSCGLLIPEVLGFT